jgi:hypothetical protein
MQTLIDVYNIKKYNYDKILNNKNVILSLNNNTKLDLNVIIGVKGRYNNFTTSIKYLKDSIQSSQKNIGITIVEMDNRPQYYESFKNENLNYIFIPLNICESDDMYSRALGFNIGFKVVNNSDFYLFHDCDVIVPKNFFSVLFDNYINNNFTWLQPYNGKRLLMLNEKTSTNIINSIDLIDTNKLELYKDYIPGGIGSPGFTILLKKETFEQVGGFDPELFYGYAPEDAFFFLKLCCLTNEINSTTTCHMCDNSHYAMQPKIELFHLYHELMKNENKFFNIMARFNEIFMKESYLNKMKYINIKKTDF